MSDVIKGFKVFNPDWTCGGKQYACPGRFKENVENKVGSRGISFCLNAADCFNYYKFDPNSHVVEVIAHGQIEGSVDKYCTDDLEIVREISWYEVLRIARIEKKCTGIWNTDDCNTGSRNTGDHNTGSWNTGNWNTGDYNTTSFSSGVFNTEESKILMFNKPSDWSYRHWLKSEARRLLIQIPENAVEWIWSDDMTDEEKAEHPTYETTGGYLRILDRSESGQIWWNSLSNREKDVIRNIPNYDKAIFERIIGFKAE